MSHLWDIRQSVRTLAEDIVRIRHKEMTIEDIEDFIYAAVIVIFRVRKVVRLLYLFVVTSFVCNCLINQITNPV
jgi:hypothetical protein